MKLLVIFNKDMNISPEKVCVHTGHSSRNIALITNVTNKEVYDNWEYNDFKTVLLTDKIGKSLVDKVASFHYNYCIVDAGRDGVYTPGTVLGYAVLVPDEDETFKRSRVLKFN